MKRMQKKLKDITTVQMGYTFRGAIKNNDDGNMFVISAKDVRNNFIITNKGLKKIDHPINKNRLLKEDDVILSNRMYFKASVVDINENTIAASSIYVLRVDKKIILPEYLAL